MVIWDVSVRECSPGRGGATGTLELLLVVLENGHRLHKRKLAAMLATAYVGKYVLEALDIYHFMGRVDC